MSGGGCFEKVTNFTTITSVSMKLGREISAEACGIRIKGQGKWKTIIENEGKNRV